MDGLNLNQRAFVAVGQAAVHAAALGAAVHTVGKATVIDAGVNAAGSIEAGLLLARVCLADLGTVGLTHMNIGEHLLPAVQVSVNHPVAACMASQYAGWQIKMDKFFAMGSGPMRSAYGHEKLFDDIGYRESPECAVGVLETGTLPDEGVIALLAEKCRVDEGRIALLAARTASLAGGVQVVARSVETALHKLHELKFDLGRIVAGFGVAPLPPVARHDMAAIGRTNDAVLYGASVTLYVNGDDDSLIEVGKQLPSNTSRDYGKPFYDLFKSYDFDFYKIDPLLFSPARICLQNIKSGRSHFFGQLNPDLLAQSFFS